ncbi:hypothetical protein MRB53_016479 [Persea americana]|uniref:Uncharacterized protein n=1 Tax=Persea americana TaxID=3435 RepID=A0ACC2M2B8_PERAE|nr:hypothetical protein MRB53_016479 [Persea americana]
MAKGMQGLQMEVQLCILEGSQAKLKEPYERHGKLLTNILQRLENLLSAEGSTRKTSQANHVVVERGLWRCSIPTNGDVRSTPSKFDRHCPNDSTVVSTDDKNGKNAKEILTELGKAYPDKATTIVAKRSRVQKETTFFGAGGSLANIWGCASAKSKPSCQSPETATVTPPLHGDKDQASQLDPSQKFKLGTYHVLVATDVAAHGLNIKSVVNFDVAILVINAFVCAFEVGMAGNGEGKIKKHAQLIRCVGGEHKIIAIATTCKLEEIALSDQASLHSNPSTLDEYGKAPNGGQRIHLLPFPNPSLPMQPRSMDPSKDSVAYGYGSIAWKERMKSWKQKQEKLQVMRNENGGEDWDNEDDGPDLPLVDEARQPLPRKMPIPSSQINPNRMYEKGSQQSQLSLVDIFVSTVDSLKEPVTNAILSILVVDYPIDKVCCYIFYEGAAMLTLEALSETSDFTRKWVPFCKKFNDDQVAPEWYFAHKMDYLKDMVLTSFGKGRRAMKRGFGMLQKVIVWSCRCIGAKLN